MINIIYRYLTLENYRLMDHPLFFLAYRRMLIFLQEWFLYYLLFSFYYHHQINVSYLIPLMIGGFTLVLKEYVNLGFWEDQLKIHHTGHKDFVMSWQYLSFRHTMVSLDTWFFVILIAWLVYLKNERAWFILTPVITCGIIFNLVGYYYLYLLEQTYIVNDESQYFSIYSI